MALEQKEQFEKDMQDQKEAATRGVTVHDFRAMQKAEEEAATKAWEAKYKVKMEDILLSGRRKRSSAKAKGTKNGANAKKDAKNGSDNGQSAEDDEVKRELEVCVAMQDCGMWQLLMNANVAYIAAGKYAGEKAQN